MVVMFRAPEGLLQPDSGRRNFRATASSMAGGVVPIGRLECPGGRAAGYRSWRNQKAKPLKAKPLPMPLGVFGSWRETTGGKSRLEGSGPSGGPNPGAPAPAFRPPRGLHWPVKRRYCSAFFDKEP